MDYSKYIDQGIAFADEFIKQHGATAWETVLFLVRIQGVQQLVIGLVCLIGFLICTKIMFIVYRKIHIGDYHDRWDEAAWVPFGLGYVFIGGGLFMGMFCNLFYIWNWIAVFHPQLYLAKMALDKVIN